MKKCPFCAEDIQDEAIKCKHCGEFLTESTRQQASPQKAKWYQTNSAVVVALVCFGPFALPTVWFNPRYNIIAKAVITVVVIIVTIWLCNIMMDMYQDVVNQINSLGL